MKDSHKTKILVVSQHFWPESFRINDICDFLVNDKKCDVDVLCGLPNYPLGKFYTGYSYFKNKKETHNGLCIRRVLEIPRGNNSNLRIFINYISFPIFSLFHIPYLLTKHYDKILIYQTSPVMMSIVGITIGKLKRVETTICVMDLWPENLFSVLNFKNKLIRKFLTVTSHWYYKKADKLIAMTEKMKEKLIDVTNKSSDKVVIIPQAAEKIYESEVHDKVLKKRFEKSFNILFTGNISPAQSFETIIGAAKILKTKGLDKIKWIIVGDGMSRKWLEAEVAKNDLTDLFVFEGQHPVADIPKYTAIADILVGCLSKSDLLEATIPAKVYSYIAAGKPIVLAMDGEVQQLINQIRCGFAGPTEDSTALTQNISKIYHSTKLDRDAMGKRAKLYHFKNLERNLTLNKLFDFLSN